MIIRHQYFRSKWSTSIEAMTHLHGGAANGLKSMSDAPLGDGDKVG